MSTINTSGAVYDARQLGKGRMLVLGLQHMFAMFGATILVPTITGLSVSATLLFAGLGTLLFHCFTKMKVPAFLGSSFAFLGGYATVVAMGNELGMSQAEALPYACVGVVAAGLLYFVLAAAFRLFGVKRVMKLFPPVVTGPIIISIGLILAGTAVSSILTNWWIALIAILVVIVCNIWGKGMIKIIPILLGVLASYVVAAVFGQLEADKVQALHDAAWIGVPFYWQNTGMYALGSGDWSFLITAIVAIMPIALATMIEHIGDMCAISSTCNRNYLEDPGLHRTLMGDGAATILASLFGAPANTTYGENRRVADTVRYDLLGGYPQFGGEPRGFDRQPQPHHHSPDHHACRRHQLWLRRRCTALRQHWHLGSGCGSHCGYPGRSYPAQQEGRHGECGV